MWAFALVGFLLVYKNYQSKDKAVKISSLLFVIASAVALLNSAVFSYEYIIYGGAFLGGKLMLLAELLVGIIFLVACIMLASSPRVRGLFKVVCYVVPISLVTTSLIYVCGWIFDIFSVWSYGINSLMVDWFDYHVIYYGEGIYVTDDYYYYTYNFDFSPFLFYILHNFIPTIIFLSTAAFLLCFGRTFTMSDEQYAEYLRQQYQKRQQRELERQQQRQQRLAKKQQKAAERATFVDQQQQIIELQRQVEELQRLKAQQEAKNNPQSNE
ncbi:MAG: hypothetical protein J6B41_04555 [Alistipes sp.]|nr:hypothetical protein [Alistipes sp.]